MRLAAGVFFAAGLLASWLVSEVRGEPPWTRTGDCRQCHVDVGPGWLMVYDDDGVANPTGGETLKVFRTQRGKMQSLSVAVAGLPDGAGYDVVLQGVRTAGVGGGDFRWYPENADCGWAGWRQEVYTSRARAYDWPVGPETFQFDFNVRLDADYDYYEWVFAVVGVDAFDGSPFWSEERFYVHVTPPNDPPTVAITAPANDATLRPAPRDIAIVAIASDSDGTIAQVEFFQGTTWLGQDTTSPYGMTWRNVAKGDYALTARATDNGGLATTSAVIAIHVRGVPGDSDDDGDVDQTDFGHFQQCLTGPGTSLLNPACRTMDLDGDVDVDQADYGIFQGCMSGADVPADPTCVN